MGCNVLQHRQTYNSDRPTLVSDRFLHRADVLERLLIPETDLERGLVALPERVRFLRRLQLCDPGRAEQRAVRQSRGTFGGMR